jgi:acetyltransferase-like isoleucine patch superfamily enzyme
MSPTVNLPSSSASPTPGTPPVGRVTTVRPTKEHAKQLLRLLGRLAVMPLYARTIFLDRWLGDEAFRMASQALSRRPGPIGNYMRAAFYRLTLPRCGADACLEFGTVLHQPTVEIGQRVYIGANCSIGACVIEDDVLIGSNVDIISGRHQHYFDHLDRPIREQGGHYERIVVGADCWIGNSSVVMANVGHQSIVGAGSVVTRDVPPRSIVAGNPATVLRRR